MEKVRSYYSLEQAEKDTLFFKLRLQDIMATLRYENEQHDNAHKLKINLYEKQIESKNYLIFQLSQQLENSKKQLEHFSKENKNCKQVILQLKREFFKMFQAVRRMNDSQSLVFQPQPTLPTIKRVKSDLHLRRVKEIRHQQRQSLFSSPTRQMRIDINSYFLNLKQLNLIKEEKSSFDQKGSSLTKHTDKQMGSSGSQNVKETTCFKDLLIKEIQNNSNMLDKKASINLRFAQSSTNLKSTWAKTYKQNWKSTI